MKESFDSLVGNALDFMDNAIAGIKDKPKYSLINYYSAIELFLKARLLHEHWSLIVSKPEEASIDKFKNGDFNSVNLKEINSRLKNICKDPLTQSEYGCFDSIRKHRNMIVHFFNKGYNPVPDKAVIRSNVIEQYRGWFYLHKLLSERWKDVFANFDGDISRINNLMYNHREYLEAKFKELKDTIKQRKQNGDIIIKCFACNFNAAVECEIVAPLFNQICLVCESSGRYLKVACPKCGANISLTDPTGEKCPKCHVEIEPSQLAEKYKELSHHEEKIGETAIASCCECSGYETVARINGLWVCFSCLETFHSVDECEWCGQKITGDSEDTFLEGCMHCNGHFGWKSDE